MAYCSPLHTPPVTSRGVQPALEGRGKGQEWCAHSNLPSLLYVDKHIFIAASQASYLRVGSMRAASAVVILMPHQKGGVPALSENMTTPIMS